MIRKILAALTIAAVAVSFSLVTFAQEKVKSEAKKGEKKTYYKVQCDPTCGFMVRSHDQNELTGIVMKHAKHAHDMDMTEKDVAGMTHIEKVAVKEEGVKKAKKEEKKY